ncbi:MAG: arsenate reductase [Pseudohongiellaceae bacterium]|jgi:arsenate reductase
MAKPKNFLFVCKGNNARSQMAEGFARSMASSGLKIFSAGLSPEAPSGYAVEVMGEIGIDISVQDATAFEDVPLNKIDTLVTLSSDADAVPPKLKKKVTTIHWPLDDPSAEGGTEAEVKIAFRMVRDEIRNRIEVLLVG